MDYYDEIETGQEFKPIIKTETPDNHFEPPGSKLES